MAKALGTEGGGGGGGNGKVPHDISNPVGKSREERDFASGTDTG